MSKQCIDCPNAAPAAGPYSHAVAANGLLFVSGQIPVARDGSGVVSGPIEDQARLALENLKVLLEDAGLGVQDVVKMTVFLASMDDFGKVNEVYKEFFVSDCPARSCVEVARLPLGVGIEVEAIAALRD